MRRLAFVTMAVLAAAGVMADATTDKSVFKDLKYRLVGPFVGGRITRVAGVAGDPLTYYAGVASGGVWKSIDGGATWKPIFDDQPISSIGSLAVAPSDPSVIYVGAGEANIRGNVAPGNGIYKSVDSGKTWTHVWKQEGQIGTIAVHPKDSDVAFAAVLGHAFGPNPERGVYRTRDGGKSWQQVLKKDADTGASDVCLDPNNPAVVFAGLWQARRRPWEMTSGGPGSGFYVSRDSGDTWKRLGKDEGLPEGIWGKVGCAVAPSDSRRVYVLIEAEKGGLFRSDDNGDKWTMASDHRALLQRAWYYTTLNVDPTNKDIVWFPQVPLLRSLDGGKTIKRVKGPHHGDHHDLWIDPQNPRRIIDGNDGGVDITHNGGETWFSPRLPIGQCYHVATDASVPYRVSCALQDLGTASGPSNSLSADGINHGDWYDVGGGEAGHVAHDWSDPNVVYAGEYLGIITRYDHRTRQARHVGIYPNLLSGSGAEAGRYRFQWTAPIHVSPHDPKVVYHGGNVLFRTADGGQTWAAISPDLTRNDRSKQKWSGGPITGDNTGVEHYGVVFAVAESPKEKGLIWVGTDDGLVQVTRDGGETWTKVTPAGLPEWGTVAMVEPSPHDAAIAYVAVDAHRLDDQRPYLWKTADYGKTWKRIGTGLPAYARSVREDPRKKRMLYAGTETGVFFSRDDGASWQPLKANLPTVAIADLVVKDDDLVLGTQGRSIWIFDDLTPVRELTAGVASAPLHLFPARPTVQWRYRGSFHEEGPGENPPDAALIHYHLKEEAKEVTLEVRDSSGKVVRTLTSKEEEPEVPEDDPDAPWGASKKKALPRKAGLHRVTWDLTHQGARKLTNAKYEGGNPQDGPYVLPGTYSLILTANGHTVGTTLEVRPDPRLTLPAGDPAAQNDMALRVRDDLSLIANRVNQIRSARAQLQARADALRSRSAEPEWVKSAEDALKRLEAIESRYHNPEAQVEYDILAKRGTQLYSDLNYLYSFLRWGDGAPTQGMKEVYADHRRELDAIEADWKGVAETVTRLGLVLP